MIPVHNKIHQHTSLADLWHSQVERKVGYFIEQNVFVPSVDSILTQIKIIVRRGLLK